LKVNENAPVYHWNASVSVGANNESLISWDSLIGIYARLLDPRGHPIDHEFRVNQFVNGHYKLGWEACSHTAILSNGNFVVGWVGNGAEGNGLYLTMFNKTGDPASK
jgi:hypothetical protein